MLVHIIFVASDWDLSSVLQIRGLETLKTQPGSKTLPLSLPPMPSLTPKAPSRSKASSREYWTDKICSLRWISYVDRVIPLFRYPTPRTSYLAGTCLASKSPSYPPCQGGMKFGLRFSWDSSNFPRETVEKFG
ncbi:hypothetical protein VKT23_016853 [Stygiomarasmius scandens]|uniref:Uncharacterized protein n=1 Tax=Marasmiellus scandens TaxID=2682957 RepID=A0ABR1ITQ6_9AGAR